ncbi:MAG TPA: hypothetical protein VMH20_20385, partial [Verrucomicrobiae bacterium]|nr:hypothetical protein [Verrucomicrobiae bacterium]
CFVFQRRAVSGFRNTKAFLAGAGSLNGTGPSAAGVFVVPAAGTTPIVGGVLYSLNVTVLSSGSFDRWQLSIRKNGIFAVRLHELVECCFDLRGCRLLIPRN